MLSIHSANYDHSIGGADARAQGQFNLIKEVAQYIPDFDACYSIEDTPTQFVSWAHMRELKALAEEEECKSFSRSLRLTETGRERLMMTYGKTEKTHRLWCG